MRTLSIVKAEVGPEIPHRVWRIAVVLQVNVFVFDRSPQPFHEDVVQRTATAVHADQNVLGFEPARERIAGELRALSGVEYFRTPVLQRAVQCRTAEFRIQARRYFPTEHIAAEP